MIQRLQIVQDVGQAVPARYKAAGAMQPVAYSTAKKHCKYDQDAGYTIRAEFRKRHINDTPVCTQEVYAVYYEGKIASKQPEVRCSD